MYTLGTHVHMYWLLLNWKNIEKSEKILINPCTDTTNTG